MGRLGVEDRVMSESFEALPPDAGVEEESGPAIVHAPMPQGEERAKWRLLHRRDDGTFVIENEHGWPYHVTADDPLFAEVAQAAAGQDLPPEPVPSASAPPVHPTVISRRQLILALHASGVITAEEALAAAKTGEVPAAIDAVFARLPPDQALAARITWASMVEVRRDHPLIEAVIAAGLATAEQVDELFKAAASL
jgi:hypothetical protein